MPKAAIKTRQIQSKPVKRRKIKANLVDKVHEMMMQKGFSIDYWCTHSGLSQPTIINMRNGKTRQPYHTTLEAILNSIGHELVIQPVGRAQIVPIKQTHNVKFRYLRPKNYRVKKKG